MTIQNPLPITQEQIRLGSYNSREFAPPQWQIPREFLRGGEWSNVASHLMWTGSSAVLRAHAKPGINRDQALLHIGAVLHAVDMSVEHREAAAASLLATWFDSIELYDGIAAGIGVGRRRPEGQGDLSIGA